MRFLRWLLPAIVAGGLVVWASSCGTRAPRCLASNCPGCCDAEGQCQPGDQPTACGVLAAACKVCESGACQEGVCLPSDGSNDGGNPNDGGERDAGVRDGGGGVDAGFSGTVWYRGDFLTVGVERLGRTGLVALPLPGQVSAFAVSPDRSKIVVGTDAVEAGRFDLMLANPDGSNPLRIVQVPSGSRVRSIRFSPSGAWLAFEADLDAAGVYDIWVVPFLGGTPARATPLRPTGQQSNGELGPLAYCWSRDSRYLAVVGDYEVNAAVQLYIADLSNATAPSVVVAVSQAAVGTPTGTANIGVEPMLEWTVAGKLLFKAKLTTDSGKFRLHQVDANGQNLRVLANSPSGNAQLGAFGLSPNGASLAFSADTLIANAYEVYRLPVDGALAPALLTSGTSSVGGPNVSAPLLWSPDGTRIAFTADYVSPGMFDLYTVPITGGSGASRVIATLPRDGGQDFRALAWSPNSQQIAAIADWRVDQRFEVIRTENATSSAQTPVVVQGVPSGGNVLDLAWTQTP
ncbi:MAG: TolB family protein [Myxococcota bacterium]